MSPSEIEEARELVKDMEETADNGHYFEINAESTRLLHRYIKMLEEATHGK